MSDPTTQTMDSIQARRALLFSIRIQYSPQAQSIRDAAIERMVEQALSLIQPGEALSLPELHAIISSELGGSHSILLADVRAALARLSRMLRLLAAGDGLHDRTYTLSDTARSELEAAASTALAGFSRVVRQLFTLAPGGATRYEAPFIECLHLIFSNVAETYVRLITGELDENEIVNQVAIRNAVDSVVAAGSSISEVELEKSVTAFLSQSNPDYDAIKWNMTQNAYVLKALGLDHDAYLLSREVFSNTVLYLDTNVVFQALQPQARHYSDFAALSVACRELGIDLRVTQASLNELRGVVEYQRDLLEKVENEIPDELADRIDNVLFRAYREAKAIDPDASVSSVLGDLESAADALKNSHDVELADDLWFDDQRSSDAVRGLSTLIKSQYEERHPQRNKSVGAATHDALLLLWVERERARGEQPVWLVTLDTSLPGFVPDPTEADSRPLAITLDALLQWIWPITSHAGATGDMAGIFSDALKFNLLPRERFLDLKDFEVLADLQLSCKDLPAQDVEDCIRLIKREAPNLNLSTADGREKLAYQLARFFSTPGRRYKLDVERLEGHLAAAAEEQRQQDERRLEEFNAFKAEMEAKLGDVEAQEVAERDQVKESLADRDKTICDLQSELLAQKEAQRKARMRSSAHFRLALGFLLLFLLELGIVWVAAKYGEGDNLVQQLEGAAYFLVGALVFSVTVTLLFLGRERIVVLSWPMRRLFGMTESSNQNHD